jgi:hypothetical protein
MQASHGELFVLGGIRGCCTDPLAVSGAGGEGPSAASGPLCAELWRWRDHALSTRCVQDPQSKGKHIMHMEK